MVFIIHDCNCFTCPGAQSVKRPPSVGMVFGGSLCNCSCHKLEGKEREDFLNKKDKINVSFEEFKREGL